MFQQIKTRLGGIGRKCSGLMINWRALKSPEFGKSTNADNSILNGFDEPAHGSIALWMFYQKSFKFDSIRAGVWPQNDGNERNRKMARILPSEFLTKLLVRLSRDYNQNCRAFQGLSIGVSLKTIRQLQRVLYALKVSPFWKQRKGLIEQVNDSITEQFNS